MGSDDERTRNDRMVMLALAVVGTAAVAILAFGILWGAGIDN